MPIITDHYAVLGIPRTATPDEIKHAYRHEAKLAHPDAGGSAVAMERINAAYAILSDPASRHEYDLSRQRPLEAAPTGTAPSPGGRPAPPSHEHYRQAVRLRRAAARADAWQLVRSCAPAAIVLTILTRYLVPQLTDLPTKLLLAGAGFLPVFGLILGAVFIVSPDLRLDVHDLAHRRRPSTRADGYNLLAFLGAFFALGAAWVVVMSGLIEL